MRLENTDIQDVVAQNVTHDLRGRVQVSPLFFKPRLRRKVNDALFEAVHPFHTPHSLLVGVGRIGRMLAAEFADSYEIPAPYHIVRENGVLKPTRPNDLISYRHDLGNGEHVTAELLVSELEAATADTPPDENQEYYATLIGDRLMGGDTMKSVVGLLFKDALRETFKPKISVRCIAVVAEHAGKGRSDLMEMCGLEDRAIIALGKFEKPREGQIPGLIRQPDRPIVGLRKRVATPVAAPVGTQ